jgi:hypothetical protein
VYLLLVVGLVAAYVVLLLALAPSVNAFRLRRGTGGPVRPLRVRPGQVAIVAGIGFFFLSLTDPWVPPEILVVRASPHISQDILQPDDGFVRTPDGYEGVAYVLRVDLAEVTILTDRNRRVMTLHVHDVLARHVCRDPGHSTRTPLFAKITRADSSPNLPQPSGDRPSPPHHCQDACKDPPRKRAAVEHGGVRTLTPVGS